MTRWNTGGMNDLMSNTTTPVLPEPVLSTYFAIQLQPRENPAVVVEAFCTAAKMLGTLFRRVETLDTIEVGMKPFLRMRSDIPTASSVLEQLFKATGRGYVVSRSDGKFEVQFPVTTLGGRRAEVSSYVMHTVPRGKPTMYRGPKIKFWERQFLQG